MATYVALINFTDNGVLHVEGIAKGQYNVVSIVGAPDEASRCTWIATAGR